MCGRTFTSIQIVLLFLLAHCAPRTTDSMSAASSCMAVSLTVLDAISRLPLAGHLSRARAPESLRFYRRYPPSDTSPNAPHASTSAGSMLRLPPKRSIAHDFALVASCHRIVSQESVLRC